VVEIGPGRGALTENLLPQVGKLHLIEFDRDLARYWGSRDESHLSVHAGDVLQFDFSEVDSDAPLKVIGNLPYNISSPVLFHLLSYSDRVQSQVVMLQKEVVERIAATPGNKQYGRLSVILQYRYEVENLFTVPPTAFFPKPKVDSAVVRLMPKSNIQHPAHHLEDLSKVVKYAFSQRRKTLRNTLKPILNSGQIESLGIDPGVRAESLGVDQFVALANLYSEFGEHHREQ